MYKLMMRERALLKELSVEQCGEVVVHRQLVAVPQNGCHTVEVGGGGHEEAVLPQ